MSSNETRVVALETSGPIGGICVVIGGRVVAERNFSRGMEHGRMLVPSLQDACREARLDPRRDIDLIAVSQGPGSFTGLRIGIAAAKAMAFVAGCPLAGVSSLDVLVENAPATASRACVVVDAKRGQVYAAIYERREGSGGTRSCASVAPWQRQTEDLLISPRALLERVGQPAYLIGDGLAGYPEAFSAAGFERAPEVEWTGKAHTVARIGLQNFREGKTIPYLELAPIYHRLPEAEEKRLAQTKK
jgi:tRNA threonylcarbamoyladenosine biosynthesis protein TsaB